jgi:hypothetical protein
MGKALNVAHMSPFVALLAVLISGGALYVSVRTSPSLWPNQDLLVYLRFPNPQQIGTATLDLNYFFINMGNQGVMIENVSIGDLWIKSAKPGVQGQSSELTRCSDRDLMYQACLSG